MMQSTLRTVSEKEVRDRWLVTIQSVFTGAPLDENPFRPKEWVLSLLPGGLVLDSDVFSALAKAALIPGDSAALIAPYDQAHWYQPAFCVPFHQPYFVELASGTLLGHTEALVVGASATWGLIASPETFAVFGAEPGVARRFEASLGGPGALRDRFIEAVRDGEIGFGEPGRQYALRLMRAAGWQAP